MIEYRSYEPADRDAVLHLLSEDLPPAQATAKAATFDWQFGGNPHNDGRSPFLLAVDGAEVVGAEGIMPARIIYKGSRRTAVWACDTHIAAAFRRQRIGTELLRRFSQGADVGLAYGINDQSNPRFTNLDWDLSRDLAGYSLHIRDRGAIGTLKNLRGKVYRLRRPSRPQALAVSVEANADFGAEVDQLWSRCARTYISVVERDAAYLNWRYRYHPLLSYRWYAARRNGQLSGLLVARPDAEISVIVDYCGPLGDDEVMNALVDAAVDDLSLGARKIYCQTTAADMARALKLNGFHQSAGTHRFRARCNFAEDRDACGGFFVMTGDSDHDFSELTTVPASAPTRGSLARSR